MDQISLWFVCKSCRSSFPGVTNFIKHKTDNHSIEFKSVTCIVFEESFAEVEGELITKPNEEGCLTHHTDGDCCSERSQSPNLTINNSNRTIINSDCEILGENKLFTNNELGNVDSRAVRFTIENDSVTINVGPLNDVDTASYPSRISPAECDVPENGICDQEAMRRSKFTVQEILDSSNSQERKQTLNSPHLHEDSDSELTVFSPHSVDPLLDSSQDFEVNSLISLLDVCTDATADVDNIDPGPDPDPLQNKFNQAGKTFEIETSLATVEPSDHLICITEENEDVSLSQSYDTSAEVVDKKYGFRENPYVLLTRLTAEELQSVATVSKPIQEHSQFIDDTGSDIDYVSINSDTTTGTSSDSETDDTCSYPKRRKLNFKKNQVGSDLPTNRHLNTSPKNTYKQKLPLSLHCDLCNKSFNFRSDMILHNFRNHLPMEEKTALARFKCEQCPKVFLLKSALRSHAESHKSETERNKPVVCEICGYSCNSKSCLEKHLTSHSDSRPLKCQLPHCDKVFKHKKYLQLHVNKFHSKLRPFKCSLQNCTKAFKDKPTLKNHILVVHEGKRRYPAQIFQCTQENCGTKYRTRAGLKYHLITVHSVGPDLETFLCELCGKAFKMKQHLQMHTLLVHTQESPFKCTIEGCSAAFKLKYRLVEHERAHGGAQNYLCTVCGKSYSIYISFHKHQLSHKKDISSSSKATL